MLGKTYRAAKRLLKQRRCTRVRSQKPKPGTKLYRGQKLRITLR